MNQHWIPAGAVALLLALGASGSPVLASGGAYTVEDLGPADQQTVAVAVNASGVATGYGEGGPFMPRVAFGHDGDVFFIPGLGGTASEAAAVNRAGLITGSSEVVPGVMHAFRYDASTGSLVDLDPFGANSRGNAITTAGVIVGSADHGSGPHAARWAPDGTFTDLGTLGGVVGQAWAVNDAGVIVGDSTDALHFGRAFRYTDSGGMVALGTFGGWFDSARAVNAAGTIVGYASALGGSQWRAARWNADGTPVDLGTLGGAVSAAYAVNVAGEIVGWSKDAAGQDRAFLITGGAMVDLNTLLPDGSGWLLTHAYDINDAGQIVGAGIFAGRMRGFRLTPAAFDTTPPVIGGVQATPDELWPANHKMVPVVVTVQATDDSGESPDCRLASVASSDPDEGAGDGNTVGDIVLDGPLTVQLRAEQSGSAVRSYRLTVDCRDAAGNTASASTTVTVGK